jgi:hypothetical protein
MGNTTEGGSCFARMLDLRFYILATRMSMLRVGADQAVTMIVIFAIIGLCCLPLWVGHDLHSTWTWATPVKESAAPTINAAAAWLDQQAPEGASVGGMTVGQLLGAITLLGITLLPTLFELGFPMIRHPLLILVLTAAILFDYVTDWEKSWGTTSTWSGADNWFVHFLWTSGWNLFVSVLVQAILVLCITVVIYGFIRLVRGAAPAALGEAAVIVSR